ncbi:hypothetical protein HK097_005475 [Rhizophlyctis rosea]|uniref:Uncharacterized protein n=1 Tax=Rhizophlyctis rosea TaxID=64517 RepID=A0AAD5X5I5_9FUNG|nr:hypothetical protein HK097_005475 [Rhizophlyctis rosea]
MISPTQKDIFAAQMTCASPTLEVLEESDELVEQFPMVDAVEMISNISDALREAEITEGPGVRVDAVELVVPFVVGKTVVWDVRANTHEAEKQTLNSILVESVHFIIPVIRAELVSVGNEATAEVGVAARLRPLAGQLHVPYVSAQTSFITELVAETIAAPDAQPMTAQLCLPAVTGVGTTDAICEQSAQLEAPPFPLSAQLIVPYTTPTTTVVAESEAVIEVPTIPLEFNRVASVTKSCNKEEEHVPPVPARTTSLRGIPQHNVVEVDSEQNPLKSHPESIVILVQTDDFDTVWMENIPDFPASPSLSEREATPPFSDDSCSTDSDEDFDLGDSSETEVMFEEDEVDEHVYEIYSKKDPREELDNFVPHVLDCIWEEETEDDDDDVYVEEEEMISAENMAVHDAIAMKDGEGLGLPETLIFEQTEAGNMSLGPDVDYLFYSDENVFEAFSFSHPDYLYDVDVESDLSRSGGSSGEEDYVGEVGGVAEYGHSEDENDGKRALDTQAVSEDVATDILAGGSTTTMSATAERLSSGLFTSLNVAGVSGICHIVKILDTAADVDQFVGSIQWEDIIKDAEPANTPLTTERAEPLLIAEVTPMDAEKDPNDVSPHSLGVATGQVSLSDLEEEAAMVILPVDDKELMHADSPVDVGEPEGMGTCDVLLAGSRGLDAGWDGVNSLLLHVEDVESFINTISWDVDTIGVAGLPHVSDATAGITKEVTRSIAPSIEDVSAENRNERLTSITGKCEPLPEENCQPGGIDLLYDDDQDRILVSAHDIEVFISIIAWEEADATASEDQEAACVFEEDGVGRGGFDRSALQCGDSILTSATEVEDFVATLAWEAEDILAGALASESQEVEVVAEAEVMEVNPVVETSEERPCYGIDDGALGQDEVLTTATEVDKAIAAIIWSDGEVEARNLTDSDAEGASAGEDPSGKGELLGADGAACDVDRVLSSASHVDDFVASINWDEPICDRPVDGIHPFAVLSDDNRALVTCAEVDNFIASISWDNAIGAPDKKLASTSPPKPFDESTVKNTSTDCVESPAFARSAPDVDNAFTSSELPRKDSAVSLISSASLHTKDRATSPFHTNDTESKEFGSLTSAHLGENVTELLAAFSTVIFAISFVMTCAALVVKKSAKQWIATNHMHIVGDENYRYDFHGVDRPYIASDGRLALYLGHALLFAAVLRFVLRPDASKTFSFAVLLSK